MSLTLPGYKVNKKIFESQRTLVYEGIKEDDNRPVAIKLLRSEYPGHNEIARFKHEYEVLKKINISNVVQAYSLEKHNNGFALVLEFFRGKPLKEIIRSKRLGLKEFLNIAVNIAAILGEIHKKNVIHKDINPRNILMDLESQEVRIIDFGLASLLQREEQGAVNPGLLEGSLPYISPEQTGRMNRGIDYRTDYYSLGITFYEMLAGSLPFDSKDAMGWVHCHIAKIPPGIRTVSPEVPEAVENILLKLMSKKAEDRYNGTSGLVWDLKKCLTLLKEKGEVENFNPGLCDISEKFQIPQKLYGRDVETKVLEDCFFRIMAGGSEMLMVGGYSGIGKSSLVNEIHKPLVEKYGYFISGKFDQFQRHIPYSAISEAFQGLMKQILAGSPEELASWKEKLLHVLGPIGQVIIEVIPLVEKIIGPQPEVPHLGTEENQSRFNNVFLQFLQVFTQKENPLVIFLDDLQWADSATLNLIKTLMMNEGNEYLLFMGAYRDNEVDHNHPFIVTMEEIKKAGIRVNNLTLKPLELDHLNQMISEAAHSQISQIKPLAQLVMDKTGGNPFFIVQFLQTLSHEGLLSFDLKQHRWTWDIEQIKSQGITDNVVELMVNKLRKLPKNTQDLLRLGACVGNSFDIKTLSIISEESVFRTAVDLWPAVEEGLLMPQGKGHHLLKNMEEFPGGKGDAPLPEAYDRFLHDRVQQAAYSLIEEDQKKGVHLKIGRLLLKETPKEELENKYFDIVEHYNKSISLLKDQAEKIKLAELNMKVGQKARESTAYEPALKYFMVSLELLPHSSWEDNYPLAFEAHKGSTECQFLSGKTEEGIRSANELLKKCKSREGRVVINNILILYYGGAGEMDKSIDIALDSLRLYNVKIPRKVGQATLLLELAETKIRQIGKNVDYLKGMPKTKDEDVIRVFSLLKELVAPTYLQGLLLLPYIILRMFKLTLINGNSETAAFFYSAYGLLWSKLGLPGEAYKFGKLAMEYNKQVNFPTMEARCYFMVTSFAMFWKQPIKDTIEPRKQGLQKLINTGETFWASYIYMFGFWQEVSLSKSMEDVVKMAEREIRFARKVKQTEPFYIHTLHRNLFMNLMGEIKENDSLDHEKGDEKNAVKYYDSNVTSTCGTFYHTTTRLVLSYYYGNYREAVLTATGPKVTAEVIADPTYNVTIYNFFTCLAILAADADFSEAEKKRYSKVFSRGKKNIRKWHGCGPDNFECMLFLLTAEEARVSGQEQQAIEFFSKAIKTAEKMDSFLYKGLANELCARFWLTKGEMKIAQAYMTEAAYLYQRWGAAGKVKNLNDTYPGLLSKRPVTGGILSHTQTYMFSNISSTSTSVSGLLDGETVIKASQAISGEIILNKLLEKLMKILIENAGARKGMLILKQEGRLFIEAMEEIGNDTVEVLQAIPVEEGKPLPVSVINYTTRTEENVVLNNAEREGDFTGDEYIKRERVKSLLSMPIINQGKLIGILYLENNLVEGAFTPDRLELLKVLSSQVAISIENALFYNTLEKKVEERTVELKEALADLKRSQQQLVDSEKMAALGQLVAGVAHEVNTPIGAIKSSAGNIADSLKETLTQLPRLFQIINSEEKNGFFKLLENQPANIGALTTREERTLRKDLMKKIEDHGIENSRNFANTFIKLHIYEDIGPYVPLLKSENADMIFDTAYKITDLTSNTKNIELAVNKASKVIFALKSFARYDHSGEMIKATLQDGLETVLTIYHNQIKQNTELIKEYEELEEIYCFPDELNQVWTNLVHNALQAMDYKGTIVVGLKKRDHCQVVSIKDSGCGIPDDVKNKIFDPFFTTKKAGEGSGLGLDIVKKIVDKHKGKIEVESKVGQGTTFSVFIPTSGNQKHSD